MILCLSLCISGCGEKYNKFTDYSFDYFDTATSIIGFEKNEAEFKDKCQKIKEKLSEYHKLYTIYSRYEGVNNIYTINNSECALEVDPKIAELLSFSKEMHTLTEGKINVAMGSVLSIWHEYREAGLKDPSAAEIPPLDVLKEASKYTDINSLVVENNTVYLKDSNTKLDVGAIAKGYAIEQTALWMEETGITGYLLNVGGNIRIVGDRPDGEKWQIGLENPDGDEDEPYIEYLSLGNGFSLVTSGSYQRYYTVEGKNFHHIIDPDTLYPAVGYKMVSVINRDSGLADALSTALFCMDYGEGERLINSLDNTYAMWVKDNGETIYSKGFKDFLKDNG